MKPKPFWLLNHFTVPLFMGDLSKVRVQIDCALTQPAHSRFWGNVVSQARYSRQGQVVRPKLDLEDIRHLWRMRKSPEAIRSTDLGLAALKDNVIRAADRFSQKHRRNGEEIRRVAGRIESGRQENRQLGCGRPERAGQVGSPLRCPGLSILRLRAPFSSRGISVV